MKISFTKRFLSLESSADIVGEAIARFMRNSDLKWIIGDPRLKQEKLEDNGQTLRTPAAARFWAVREYSESNCDCGCDGESEIEFRLPER